MLVIKIVWGITGSGDLLNEVTQELENLASTEKIEITTIISNAAKMVLNWYKLTEKVKAISKKFLIEYDANTPFIAGPLQIGSYHSLLVAPATANTVAKIVHGIADTLITNAVSQAMKGGTQIIILPVDQKPGKVVTILPNGKKKKLLMRDIDIENSKKLRKMKGITVLEKPQDIRKIYSI